MRILAFDTATRATAVALDDETAGVREVRHDPPPDEHPGHASQLLPLISSVMDRARVSWRDLDRIAVGLGPGTFTGLRIGVATARALAQATGAGVVGVSTLQALALNPHRLGCTDAGVVLAVLDARRGEVYAGAWDPRRLGDDPVLPVQALTPRALCAAVPGLGPRPLGIGEGAVAFRDVLERAGVYVPDDPSELHRVSAAGHGLLARRLPVSRSDALVPDYQRPPDAKPRSTVSDVPHRPH